MRLTRVFAISVIAASLGLGVVHAQSYSALDSPAEFPPSNYKGKQYVDSRGCVYIRAGVDGNTTWVPRVSRDRKVICGFKPTFAEPVAGTAKPPRLDKDVVTIAPAAKPTESPAIFGTSKPKAKAPATTATAAKPKVTPPAPKPAVRATAKPKTTTSRTTTSSGQPLFTTPTAVPPANATTRKTTASTTTAPRRTSAQPARAAGSLSPCRGGASTYKGMKVRCGPQSENPVTPGSGNPTAASPKMQFDRQSSLRRGTPGQIVREGEVSPQTRVLPRHVYESNLVTQVQADVPEGYRRVFDDGRLNPRRAEMTFAGKAQTDKIWTRRTPRRLIPREVGDAAVASTGSSSRSSTWGAPFEPEPVARSAATPIAPASVSTRSAAAEKTMRVSGTPYVQVGIFDTSSEAQSVARQVRRLGLPVRIGKYQRGQETRRIVLAGPFNAAKSAEAALDKTHGAGFGSAFLRQ